MALKRHEYALQVEWTGNHGEGTRTYKSYSRDYSINAAGKHSIQGSSDPAFLGDRCRYNPEELLVASLSSCHMLWYLHLCAVNGVTLLAYSDAATGVMEEGGDGSGEFTRVDLQPVVTVASSSDATSKAIALHEEAHARCFLARSVRFPVKIAPRVIELKQQENGR
jgi:organic hydroperoxide reductase OsmC/OhrA